MCTAFHLIDDTLHILVEEYPNQEQNSKAERVWSEKA